MLKEPIFSRTHKKMVQDFISIFDIKRNIEPHNPFSLWQFDQDSDLGG
jgi:hypothetical protein